VKKVTRLYTFSIHSRCILHTLSIHSRCILHTLSIHSRCILHTFSIHSRCILHTFSTHSLTCACHVLHLDPTHRHIYPLDPIHHHINKSVTLRSPPPKGRHRLPLLHRHPTPHRHRVAPPLLDHARQPLPGMHCAHALYSCTVLMHCTHTLYSCTVLPLPAGRHAGTGEKERGRRRKRPCFKGPCFVCCGGG
jgi:hypothetical protein